MQLHYKTHGSGPPLVILHGLFGSLNNWNTLSRKFGESFTVFAVDQRNHGRSPQSERFSYELMADDLKEFLRERQIAVAHILGHSMGGKTAMLFAANHPENVARLVVVDIAPKRYDPSHDHLLEAMSELPLDEIASRKEADVRLAEKVKDITVRQFLLTNLVHDASGRFQWKFNLSALRRNYAAINDSPSLEGVFPGPVLFVVGGRSTYVERNDVASIRTRFPHSQIVTIAHAGHWVHAEAPEEFARIVLEFLREPD